MPDQLPSIVVVKSARRCGPLPPLVTHAVAGLALAGLFVGLLCFIDSTMARLLWGVGGPAVLVVLILLHAALFACAGFATATDAADGDGDGAVVPVRLRLAAARTQVAHMTNSGR